MATEWGNNSLAPGASHGWNFVRANVPGFQPVLQVVPLTPSNTGNLWYKASDGYTYLNQLGVSTIWSQLSADLKTVLYFMVVTNNSNSTLEYAFLEGDLSGPATVPAPSGGFRGNVNYFLDDNGNALKGVSVTLNFTIDFVSSANGYSFQLNGYSTEGTSITTEWQQFVIYASPNSKQLWARIDTWSGTQLTDELNRIDVALATLPDTKIPASYSLNITLTYTNDGTGTITGANYSVTDNNGKSLGTASIGIVGQTLRTTNQPATAANLAPLAALTMNIGGDYGGADATLKTGAGTIVYQATNFLGAASSEPSYTDFDDGTEEDANITFGPLANVTSQTVSQSFSVVPSSSLPVRAKRPPGSRLLPAPDEHSIQRP